MVHADNVHLLGENTYYKYKQGNLSVVGKKLSLGVIMRRVRKIAGSKRKVQKMREKLSNG